MAGRYGFSAPEVEIFTKKFASGKTMYFGKALRPRTCGLRMICTGKDSAERDRLFFDMLDVLLDADGTGEGKLYVRSSGGRMLCLNCVYSSGMRIAREYRNLSRFTVEFYAADPWFYYYEKFDLVHGRWYQIHNHSNYNLYPRIHFAGITNRDIPPYILRRVINEDGDPEYTYVYLTPKAAEDYRQFRYEDIEIYTDPDQRGVYATKSYASSEVYKDVYVPELIDGGNESLDLPLPPGENALLAANFLRSGVNFIEIAYKYPGV
jgi:hypothetical protein